MKQYGHLFGWTQRLPFFVVPMANFCLKKTEGMWGQLTIIAPREVLLQRRRESEEKSKKALNLNRQDAKNLDTYVPCLLRNNRPHSGRISP